MDAGDTARDRQPQPATPKVFCVGLPKTGTTSMLALGRALGYKVADQREGEKMYCDNDFDVPMETLRSFCDKYEFFQDLPFCTSQYHGVIRKMYPESLFVLTTRADAGQWYSSVVRFYAQIARTDTVPSWKDLDNVSKFHGRPFSEVLKRVYPCMDSSTAFAERPFKNYYDGYNSGVMESFPDTFAIDVSKSGDLPKLLRFLGKEDYAHKIPEYPDFPHMNKTKLLHIRS